MSTPRSSRAIAATRTSLPTGAMRTRDLENLREDLNQGVRLANSLGLDVSDVEMPSFS